MRTSLFWDSSQSHIVYSIPTVSKCKSRWQPELLLFPLKPTASSVSPNLDNTTIHPPSSCRILWVELDPSPPLLLHPTGPNPVKSAVKTYLPFKAVTWSGWRQSTEVAFNKNTSVLSSGGTAMAHNGKPGADVPTLFFPDFLLICQDILPILSLGLWTWDP